MTSNKNDKKMKIDLHEKKLLNIYRPAFIANAKRAMQSTLSKKYNKYVDTFGNTRDRDGNRVKISEMLRIASEDKREEA